MSTEPGSFAMLPKGWDLHTPQPLTVIPPGANVSIAGIDKIVGHIVQVCIHGNNSVQYQVAWWDGRTRKIEWMEACEMKACQDTAKQSIGFIQG